MLYMAPAHQGGQQTLDNLLHGPKEYRLLKTTLYIQLLGLR